ncbi:MAG: ChaN family lipoprotein, partial [Proteobacteria bacterium]|nr:ChaN family lipoprotein [Burkholderiales bacterium]
MPTCNDFHAACLSRCTTTWRTALRSLLRERRCDVRVGCDRGGTGARRTERVATCVPTIRWTLALTACACFATFTAVAQAQDAEVCGRPGTWLGAAGAAFKPRAATEIIADAARRTVVLLGEQHDNIEHHRWQLQMLAALHGRRADLVIGFEMFPRRVQGALDRW